MNNRIGFQPLLGGVFVLLGVGFALFAIRPENVSMWMVVAYCSVILYSAGVLYSVSLDIFAPKFFFPLYCLVVFCGNIFAMQLLENWEYFPRFFYYLDDARYLARTVLSAFLIFITGYVPFSIAARSVSGGLRLQWRERPVALLPLAVVAYAFTVLSFAFRSTFHVGVPGFTTSAIPFAGFIYYPLLYIEIILTNYFFYYALVQKTRKYLMLSLFLLGLRVIFLAVLGWRGGFLQVALMMFIVFYYILKFGKVAISSRFKRSIGIIFIGIIGVGILLHPIITFYRINVLINGSAPTASDFIGQIRNPQSTAMYTQTLLTIFKRFPGLLNLIPIASYNEQDLFTTYKPPSMLLNVLKKDISAGQYYTWNIVGIPRSMPTTMAPTSWGALFVYGKWPVLIVGMLILGACAGFVYNTCVFNMPLNGRWSVFYAVFVVQIFIPVVFAGTIITYILRNATVFLVSFFIISFFLDRIPVHSGSQ